MRLYLDSRKEPTSAAPKTVSNTVSGTRVVSKINGVETNALKFTKNKVIIEIIRERNQPADLGDSKVDESAFLKSKQIQVAARY